MKITVVGLNHKTAPVETRERLAFDRNQLLQALGRLKNSFTNAEFVLLSTCNRVELYCARNRTSPITSHALAEFLAGFHGLQLKDFRQLLYNYEDEEAVRHLLSVASGLDSMVVGEEQIIAQVKQSYRLACEAKSTGKTLHRLFHNAFFTSKKVHATTSISAGRISIAGVAVELAKHLFGALASADVLVIGAGQTGQLLLQNLSAAGCRNITVVNRSYDRAQQTARRYGASARKWQELAELLLDANIAIASAAVKDYLFYKGPFEKIIEKRRKGPLLIIDIAVPRNFDPAISEIEDVHLYSIDDLAALAEQNRRARENDIAEGMQLVRKSTLQFVDWLAARDIGPLFGTMKRRFTEISQKELERFLAGAQRTPSCKTAAEAMVRRIAGKLSHCVIENVKAVAAGQGPAEAVKLLDSIIRRAKQISSETDDANDLATEDTEIKKNEKGNR